MSMQQLCIIHSRRYALHLEQALHYLPPLNHHREKAIRVFVRRSTEFLTRHHPREAPPVARPQRFGEDSQFRQNDS